MFSPFPLHFMTHSTNAYFNTFHERTTPFQWETIIIMKKTDLDETQREERKKKEKQMMLKKKVKNEKAMTKQKTFIPNTTVL